MARERPSLRLATAVAAITFAAATPLAGRDFETALELVRDGQAAEAVSIFRELALAGDHAAQVNLAVMYARGNGVPLDVVEASYWAWRARVMGERRAIAASEYLTSQLPEPIQNEVADRLVADLSQLAESGVARAFVALGRTEAEVRTPANLDGAALWFTLGGAFEVQHAALLRDAALSELDQESMFRIQRDANSAFAVWCTKVPFEMRPATCKT